MVPWPSRVPTLYGTSIGSSVFAGLTGVTNKHADDGPWNDKKCVGIGHPSTVRSISVLLITYVSDCLTVDIQATQTA